MLYTDQLGRKIELPSFPKRIVSLVPSQTELLYDLGLRDEVVGITKFCIHPNEWFRSKTRTGGTKKLNFDIIKQLQPDLIIGNKEENEQSQIELLMQEYPVWMSNIYTLSDALDMITRIGTLVNRQHPSQLLKLQIEAAFRNLAAQQATNFQLQTVAYFIWRDPWMAAGNNTFINDMLSRCGFQNVFSNHERYPEVNQALLRDAAPELILLSSEPYPFKEKHIRELKSICPDSKILLVDGELFSWYGSRLLKSPGYFQQVLSETKSQKT
ncbi:MAG: helical backbone metal receptor [Bacteroidia bacterium]|jgi:ABC-type Fe3+-hydroxamate transport system substrate-binding protein